MDGELVLSMFSNARKSRISKKQFNDVPMRDSSKLVSINRISDSSKDPNNSLQPKHTEAFQNLMKGILDFGKRIDEKYSTKKIESSQAIQKKNDKWKIDKINQQKGQDGQTTKEDKAVGTSLTYIQSSTYQPYFPMRSISPNVSRVIVYPDQPGVNFPPQIIQVRPLSVPRPCPIQISQVYPRPERQVFIEPLSPSRVISHQPILKRSLNASQIGPVVTQPIFHQRNPHAYGNLGRPVVNFRVVNQPQQIPQNISQNIPHNIHHIAHNMPHNSIPCGPHQNIQRINPIETNGDQTEKISVKLNPKQDQIKDIVASMNKEQIKAQAEKAGMKPQEYESCLRKQYQMFNNQNSQLIKYLSQLTQQQKKQQVNQQLIQKLASQQTNIKNITKINKVVQKNIINKQNIKNIQNVHSVQNTVNTHNSLTENNCSNVSAIHNLMMIQANNQNSSFQPLQAIPQNIHENMESRRSSKKLGMPGGSYKKIQNILNDHKIKSNQLNMAIESDMDKLNNFEQTIQMNNKIADLDDLKDKNTKEGMQILKQMDDILNKYGQDNNYNLVESKIQDKKQQPGLMNKISRIFNRADSINVMDYEPKRITESKNENSSVNSNNFLTATKQFMNDIFGMGN